MCKKLQIQTCIFNFTLVCFASPNLLCHNCWHFQQSELKSQLCFGLQLFFLNPIAASILDLQTSQHKSKGKPRLMHIKLYFILERSILTPPTFAQHWILLLVMFVFFLLWANLICFVVAHSQILTRKITYYTWSILSKMGNLVPKNQHT